MNLISHHGAAFLVLMSMAPALPVSEGPAIGLRTGWVGTTDDAANEAALCRAVEEYPLTNERLLAYAERNPPPQSWYDEDEDLF